MFTWKDTPPASRPDPQLSVVPHDGHMLNVNQLIDDEPAADVWLADPELRSGCREWLKTGAPHGFGSEALQENRCPTIPTAP